MKKVRKTRGTKRQNVPYRLNNGYPFIELGGKRRQLNDPVYAGLTGIVPGRVTDKTGKIDKEAEKRAKEAATTLRLKQG